MILVSDIIHNLRGLDGKYRISKGVRNYCKSLSGLLGGDVHITGLTVDILEVNINISTANISGVPFI